MNENPVHRAMVVRTGGCGNLMDFGCAMIGQKKRHPLGDVFNIF